MQMQKGLVKRVSMFAKALWEVESCQQNLLSKDLIKHANKVLR
jgi:hypothetical protein